MLAGFEAFYVFVSIFKVKNKSLLCLSKLRNLFLEVLIAAKTSALFIILNNVSFFRLNFSPLTSSSFSGLLTPKGTAGVLLSSSDPESLLDSFFEELSMSFFSNLEVLPLSSVFLKVVVLSPDFVSAS